MACGPLEHGEEDGQVPLVDSEEVDCRLLRRAIGGLITNWAWKSASAVAVIALIAIMAPGFFRWISVTLLLLVLGVTALQLLNLTWARHELRQPGRMMRPELFEALAKTLQAAGKPDASAAAARCGARRQAS